MKNTYGKWRSEVILILVASLEQEMQMSQNMEQILQLEFKWREEILQKEQLVYTFCELG